MLALFGSIWREGLVELDATLELLVSILRAVEASGFVPDELTATLLLFFKTFEPVLFSLTLVKASSDGGGERTAGADDRDVAPPRPPAVSDDVDLNEPPPTSCCPPCSRTVRCRRAACGLRVDGGELQDVGSQLFSKAEHTSRGYGPKSDARKKKRKKPSEHLMQN